ncbi:bifunctional 3,4-dihydroxy-2-butanone-4-phosphate synthase/GTP cyclohydrolase II [Leekyejoonella antrihumi]|uniref:Multifunctional fusion protein n=1 Tax=Leekyejoonella antrihumi TaxID=1660198 RepID=A0A563DX05_9MICO|nr:bifunctional 3,4-dihydroxy-2-butanone-4-phosphate synthase/GTP cyclohydrolase II [Leekyejoonella antrihumi]TWP34828.1 bifunctional 3,4-dihydroxy-2-butanone-4-phosphate synthase/GTP cyclohydrolase II [Leekyejoonella antrihumi]
MALATIEQALVELRAGRPVLVADDEDRENEADLIMAAEFADGHWLGWAVRYGSGVICAPMPDEVADRLQLPPMVTDNEDPKGTAYTVSVDARDGVSTGISAADRGRTLQALADPKATPDMLTRPGHIFPLRARAGGVIARQGHTEAAVDLCRLAGLSPVGAIVELVHDDGSMMRLPDAQRLAEEHGLVVITIADLVRWRRQHDRVRLGAQTQLPTRHGAFSVHGYVDLLTGQEHLALVSPLGLDQDAPLVRVHSECLTGDTFGSLRCDCGPQLNASLEIIARDGGVVIYLRGHEGRGVGLVDKLRAYALQDTGLDTVDAQTELGLPVDAREFDAAGSILSDLKVDTVRLLSNNPAKRDALEQNGITVREMVPLEVGRTAQNAHYLQTKKERLGHLLHSPGENPTKSGSRGEQA